MDEKGLTNLIRDVLREELVAFKEEVATKEDLKAFATKDDLKAFPTKEDLKAFATKEDLKAFATKEDLKAFATKEDLEAFATKEDLKAFATKEDLKAFATKEDLKAFATKEDLEAFATKEDLKAFPTKEDLEAFATKEDLEAFATKEDFGNFLLRFDARMKQFQDGVQLMLREHGNDIQEIKLKLSLEYGSYSNVMSLIDQAVGIMKRSEHEQLLHRQQTVRELVEIEKRIERIEEFKQKVLKKIADLE